MTLLPNVPPFAAAWRKDAVLKIELEAGSDVAGKSSTLKSDSLRDSLKLKRVRKFLIALNYHCLEEF
jgi:hypothetical protein